MNARSDIDSLFFEKSMKKKSILLVEDDTTLKYLWRSLVSRIEAPTYFVWVTSEAAAQREIWKMRARGQYFDLVICDIFLSGNRTGIDLWRSNREDPSHYIFTSCVSEKKLERMLAGEVDNGSFTVLPKPIEPPRYLEQLRLALGLPPALKLSEANPTKDL